MAEPRQQECKHVGHQCGTVASPSRVMSKETPHFTGDTRAFTCTVHTVWKQRPQRKSDRTSCGAVTNSHSHTRSPNTPSRRRFRSRPQAIYVAAICCEETLRGKFQEIHIELYHLNSVKKITF